MAIPSDLSFTNSFTSAQRACRYERRKPLTVIIIFAVLLLPFIELFAGGLFGAVLV